MFEITLKYPVAHTVFTLFEPQDQMLLVFQKSIEGAFDIAVLNLFSLHFSFPLSRYTFLKPFPQNAVASAALTQKRRSLSFMPKASNISFRAAIFLRVK